MREEASSVCLISGARQMLVHLCHGSRQSWLDVQQQGLKAVVVTKVPEATAFSCWWPDHCTQTARDDERGIVCEESRCTPNR